VGFLVVSFAICSFSGYYLEVVFKETKDKKRYPLELQLTINGRIHEESRSSQVKLQQEGSQQMN
jgi:hypothetical protein